MKNLSPDCYQVFQYDDTKTEMSSFQSFKQGYFSFNQTPHSAELFYVNSVAQ